MKNQKTEANNGERQRGLRPATCSVESVNRQVIENQLLTALDDKSKVAILATEEDLTMLIIALGFVGGDKAWEMRADLKQLQSAAFPPNDEVRDRAT